MTAPSGLEILKSKRGIDLVVTNIGLPGLNGGQVADAARLVRPPLKVLFMTGYAENATLASGFLKLGMQVITKPFTMEALATQLKTMRAEDSETISENRTSVSRVHCSQPWRSKPSLS